MRNICPIWKLAKHVAHWTFILIIGAILLVSTKGFSQYSVYEWANFEDGKIPSGAHIIGQENNPRVSAVPYDKITGLPVEFNTVTEERGHFGLQIQHAPEENVKFTQAGLCAGQVLDRDKLGENGRALFQGDFFIPRDGTLPTLSIVAMMPPDDQQAGQAAQYIPGLTKGFYRFSIMRKDRAMVLTVQRPDDTGPKFLGTDNDLLKLAPLPGWHRFAIAFEGREDIRCFIDGREAGFSPAKEGTLRKLIVGVILVETPQNPEYVCYVDNLSVQVSQEAQDIPESPYNSGWTIPPGPASRRGERVVATPEVAKEDIWLEPEAAWQKAQRDKVPFFLYFEVPGIPGCRAVESFFEKDPAARRFLQAHACARVDMNQLRGGTIAQSYDVFKAPTLMSVSPDAQRHKKVVYTTGDSWGQLEQSLDLK